MRRIVLQAALLTSVLACALPMSPAAASPELSPEDIYGEWQVGLAEGAGAQAVMLTKTLRVRFSPQEDQIKVGVSGGCNGMGGSGTLDGDATSFAPIISTKMACEPRLMQADTFVSSVLEGPARLWLSTQPPGHVLRIETADRSLGLVPVSEDGGDGDEPA